MIFFQIKKSNVDKVIAKVRKLPYERMLIVIACMISITAIFISYINNWIVAYGDSQSHLNIPKRVVDSITPGFAQLGGIWLPIPHLLMIPFVKIEYLYRTGLAGSIVSGIAFVVSSIYSYKLTIQITKSVAAGCIAFLVFVTNPNMLYLQTTALTEPLLICFFMLSGYYFIVFVQIALENKKRKEIDEKVRHKEFLSLIFSAFFGFCATLTRYDGWFLVVIQAGIVTILFLPWNKWKEILWSNKREAIKNAFVYRLFLTKKIIDKSIGMSVLFITLACVGIVLWFMWDGLILGDPLYFTNSEFSAKSQQQSWKIRGELPAYHNLWVSFQYYFFDSMTNVGVVVFFVSVFGFFYYLKRKKTVFTVIVLLIGLVPFFFNVLTLYLGQSVIFLPHITPDHFEWKLFNVRYGILMLPLCALLYSLVYYFSKIHAKIFLIVLLFVQIGLYGVGYSKVFSLADGIEGLSASKTTDADVWMKKHYNGGLVLMDDFARSLNIISSPVAMKDIIYIGNRPYWSESMVTPEKYASWVIVQKNDTVWKSLYNNSEKRARLYKYFVKVYTSPDIVIFKKMNTK